MAFRTGLNALQTGGWSWSAGVRCWLLALDARARVIAIAASPPLFPSTCELACAHSGAGAGAAEAVVKAPSCYMALLVKESTLLLWNCS